MTRTRSDAPPPDPMDTPNEGGAWIMDPATGKYSRDGKTEQTREPRLVRREVAQDEEAPAEPVRAADQKESRE